LQKIVCLSNGIRVVTETTDYVKSVSAGVWVGAGSADETRENNGISHFIEHMLFKGTKSRSAKDIAECMDAVGGQLNAVTAKEYTCYYTKTLTEHLGLALELISDMILNSTFTQENIDLERKVILEEISMGEDDPDNLIYDIVEEEMWEGSALAFSVVGTEESVSAIDRKMLVEYFAEKYVAENMVISLVGNFDEDEAIANVEKYFGCIKSADKNFQRNPKTIEPGQNIRIFKKDFEQCQLCVALDGYSRQDKRRYDLSVVNALFGGNMSSRLFQRVREELGLAYSVYSELNTYTSNGSLRIYVGLNPDNLVQTLRVINDEIKLLKKNKFSASEVETAKTQFKASLLMDSEGVAERECAYGKSLLLGGKVKTVDDAVPLIDAITAEGVAEAIEFVFDRSKMTVAVLGRYDGEPQELWDVLDF